GRRVAVPMSVVPLKKSTDVTQPFRSSASALSVTFTGGESVVQLTGCVSTTSGGAPTVIATAVDVVVAPWLSVALAVSWYVPAATLDQVTVYGAVVTTPSETPSWENSTC